LAGWDVYKDRLVYLGSNKILGQDGTFGIFPSGLSSIPSTDFKGVLASGDAWVMTAGNNFGISRGGVVYIKNGKIGNTDVTNVADAKNYYTKTEVENQITESINGIDISSKIS
jgi:hypothetical protein